MLSKPEKSLSVLVDLWPHYDYALLYQTHALGGFSINNVMRQLVSQEVSNSNKERNICIDNGLRKGVNKVSRQSGETK